MYYCIQLYILELDILTEHVWFWPQDHVLPGGAVRPGHLEPPEVGGCGETLHHGALSTSNSIPIIPQLS